MADLHTSQASCCSTGSSAESSGPEQLSFGDVNSDTVLAVFVNAYQHLDARHLARGLCVCKALHRELPQRVNISQLNTTIRGRNNRPQDCHAQVAAIARNFPRLKHLVINLPPIHTRGDVPLVNWSRLHFPRLQSLSVSGASGLVCLTQGITPQLAALQIQGDEEGLCPPLRLRLKLPGLTQLRVLHSQATQSTDAKVLSLDVQDCLETCPRLHDCQLHYPSYHFKLYNTAHHHHHHHHHHGHGHGHGSGNGTAGRVGNNLAATDA